MTTFKDINSVTQETRRSIREAQRKEITEHRIYQQLSRRTRDDHNKEVLNKIANDELEDYRLWENYTREQVKPDSFKVFQYDLLSRFFGATFAIKLLERDSQRIQEAYESLSLSIPDGESFIQSRIDLEKELIGLVNEERLKYIGAVVLGLSDALVELTGALAGFTLAFQNTRVIAMTGLITGIAASLSLRARRTAASAKSPHQKGRPPGALEPSLAQC